MPDQPRVITGGYTITLSPWATFLVLSATAAVLLVGSLAGQVLKYRFNHDHVFGLVNLLNVDLEMNLPTWYSSATLLLAAALLAIIAGRRAATEDGKAGYWAGLGAVFVYMSADEGASIHELLTPVLRQPAFLPGPLYYGWVLAGLPASFVVAVLYARFVWRLAPEVRRLFGAAAMLYLGGALGVEMAGASHAFRHGIDNLAYSLWTTLEEGMEMAGVAVFVYALLRQMEREGTVTLGFRS